MRKTVPFDKRRSLSRFCRRSQHGWCFPCPCHCHESAEVSAALAAAEATRQELENERLRLAACTSAAWGNTPATVALRLPAGHPYASASYFDVCAAVDREMAAEAEALALRTQRDFLFALITGEVIPDEWPLAFEQAVATLGSERALLARPALKETP